MKTFKTKALVAVAVALAALFGAAAAKADQAHVAIYNDSKSAIIGTWIANADTADPWSPVWLDGPVFPGDTVRIDVTAGSCLMDVRVTFRNGNEAILEDVNVCRGAELIAT